MKQARTVPGGCKRLAGLLLALLLFISAFGVFPAECFAAPPAQAEYHGAYGFRLHSSADLQLQYRPRLEKNYTVGGKTYYGSQRDLGRQLRNQLVQRKDQVVLRLATNQRNLTAGTVQAANARQALFVGLLNEATAQRNAVSAKDGDYLRWQLGYLNGLLYADGSKDGVYYYRVIYYNLEYYTTAAQEQWVDQYVKAYVSKINRNRYSDYRLAKKIHDDVCQAAEYDPIPERRTDNYDYSAYGCLKLGRCVCQGYALAYYRLCRELGLSVRFVYSDPQEGCHAWNLVQVGGKYYYVDCTWDDTYDSSGVIDLFFLKNEADMQAHDSVLREHALADGVYADAELMRTVRQADSRSYEPLLINMGSITVSLSKTLFTYNGKAQGPQITATFNQQPFTGFSAVGATATKPGTYTVTLQNSRGDSTRRTYTIRPAQVKNIKITKRTPKSLTLSWKKAVGATQYKIQQKKGDKWVTVKTVSANSATVGGLAPATVYKLRILAYTNTIPGAASSAYTAYTAPQAPGTPKLTSGKGSLTVKWKKGTASGYQIRYATAGNMKHAKTVKINGGKATKKKLSKLSRQKKYYVQVRAYKTGKNAAGKTVTYWSAWSGKASKTTK